MPNDALMGEGFSRESQMPARHGPGRALTPSLRARLHRTSLPLAAAILLVPTAAMAQEGSASGASVPIFIAELGLLLLVGRLTGEAAQRIGQPPLMGQLIGGLILGPSLLGLIWPGAQHAIFPNAAAQKSMIDAVAQLGVLMLLLLTGMETDLQLVKRVGRAAVTVAVAGVAVPFVCGFALGELIPAALLPKPDARLATAIFLGTALSISSVKIVAMVVREMNFMRRDLGQIIVASAILEDTIGWVIIAIALGLASAGTLDVWSVGRAVLGTAAFLAASLTVGRRIVFRLLRWTNDNFRSEFPVISAVLVIMVAMALLTQWIGVNTVLGAFVAGILIGESPILTRHIDEQLRGLITALFMPVFFALAGLSANLTVLKDPKLAALCVGLILIASIGKFVGAFVGGEIGGLTRAESLALGCGMNARGSTEVIVATIGLSMGVLDQNLFTLIVTMAILTTLAMPPMLRWSLKRVPMRKKERLRLEREELDARGFVTNLERLLLATDDSANGRFAVKLAGVIAGSGGKPTTILELSSTEGGEKSDRIEADSRAEDFKSTAESVTTLEAHPDEEAPGNVDVIRRHRKVAGAEAIAGEARKGYDLLIVGIGKTHNPNGGFSRDVSLIIDGFDGPLAIVETRGAHRDHLPERGGKILIPVNGTEVSRRAAEVGMALARAGETAVTVLYVTRAAALADKRNSARKRASQRTQSAVLKDIATLAERYEVKMQSTIRANIAPGEAILNEAKRGYDLIVLGVSRRPGDTLYFGDTANTVFDNSDASNLFVAS